jgi:anti-sigma regulatory factor (Ser/Thr protein kinase)
VHRTQGLVLPGVDIDRARSLELALSPEPGSVARARRFLTDALRRWSVPEETESVARLALSELVTNAVVHASTDLVVRVRPEPDAIWVGVSDQDRAMPVLRDPGTGATGGRGLTIVAAVARQWGVDRRFSRRGKTVWFTVALPERH